jgi:DNA-binding NarL/FixJ family response regulator
MGREAYDALAAGRWSLVGRFEHEDGKRFVVALETAPTTPGTRTRSTRGRALVDGLRSGWSNKQIAHALGMPEGTVATSIARLARRLGGGTRANLIDILHTVEHATFTAMENDGKRILVGVAEARSVTFDGLTRSEREVIDRARRGVSNAAIARERGSAARTVANQLASAYRKLGVSSRAELAAGSSRRMPARA